MFVHVCFALFLFSKFVFVLFCLFMFVCFTYSNESDSSEIILIGGCISYGFMFVHVCSFLFMFVHLCMFVHFVHVCSFCVCLFMFVHFCSCLFMFVCLTNLEPCQTIFQCFHKFLELNLRFCISFPNDE